MNQEHPEQDHTEVEVGQPLASTASPAPQEHKQEAAYDKSDAGEGNNGSKFLSRLGIHGVLTLIFSGAVAIASCIYAWTNSGQLDVMRRTLDQIKDTNKKTAEIVKANQALVDATGKLVGATEKLVGVTGNLAEATQGTVKESKELNRLTRTGVAESKAQGEATRRATLVITGGRLPKGLTGEPIRVEIPIFNIGGGEARHVAATAKWFTMDQITSFKINEPEFSAPIVPHNYAIWSADMNGIPESNRDAVKSGKLRLRLVSRLRYGDDVVQQRPEEVFCVLYNMETGYFDSCKGSERDW